MIDRQPEDLQTLHAELHALLLASEASRGWPHLSGSFTTKVVGGHEYVYFQYSDPGGTKRQFAVGLRTPAVDTIVQEYRGGRDQHAAEMAPIERLARLLRTGGLATVPHPVERVLRALGDAGVFRLGGVLVGSYAFALLGNSLGVRWPAGSWRTQDVDVAGRLALASPFLDADVPAVLEGLHMGFVPVPQFDPRHASTSFKVRGQTLRVDLITPGKELQNAPVWIPRLKAAAAPIKYLSLLIEESQSVPAVGRGATLIAVPTPARYALHKLFVSQSRLPAQQTKSGKDLHQAALLLEVLREDREEDLTGAAARFMASGPTVTARVLRGLRSAEKRWPAVADGAAFVRRALGGE